MLVSYLDFDFPNLPENDRQKKKQKRKEEEKRTLRKIILYFTEQL